MTEQIKPKQCSENTWYIPNKKGFVPEIGGVYWYCSEDGKAYSTVRASTYDFAMIEVGNCFETKQEALDAFVMPKPVDPTPLTWDELCEIASEDANFFVHHISRVLAILTYEETKAAWLKQLGKLYFDASGKYWRSKESLEAWIKQQIGK